MRQACVCPCPSLAETNVSLTIYLPAHPLQPLSLGCGPLSCFFSVRLLLPLRACSIPFFSACHLLPVTAGKATTTTQSIVNSTRVREHVGRTSGGIQRHGRRCRHWRRLADCRPEHLLLGTLFPQPIHPDSTQYCTSIGPDMSSSNSPATSPGSSPRPPSSCSWFLAWAFSTAVLPVASLPSP